MLLTVKQFADAAHISTQRVYNLLNAKSAKGIATDLQRHCKQQNGSKYIDSDALALFGIAQPLCNGEEASNTEKNSEKEPETVANPLQTHCATVSNADAIADLQSKLDEERQRREDAEKAAAVAAAERDTERRRADELAAILQKEQETSAALAAALQAAQALHAGQIRLAMNESAEDAAADRTEETQTEEGRRRGFFARLFHIGGYAKNTDNSRKT